MADMEAVLRPVKKHPVVAGVVVIGGAALLFIYMRGGFGGGGAATAGGPSAAQVAAGQAAAGMSYQLQAQGAQNQFQLAYLQQQQAGQQSHDILASQLAEQNLKDQLSIATMQVQSYQVTHVADLQNQLDIATLGANTQTHLANLGAATQLGLADITSKTMLTANQQNVGLQETLANLTAQTTQANIAANEQISLAAIKKKSGGGGGVAGFIGGFIGGLFSDERLKMDVALLYRRADGVGVYSYAHRDDPSRRYRGLIAQDVRRIYPQHVHQSGDVLMVDYVALGECEELQLEAA